jgi:tetratricopeptide (TPR) repeat protein
LITEVEEFATMRRAVVALAMLFLCGNGCSKVVPSEQGSVKSSAEQEIRAALCEMDKRDYASAQKRMERLLQSDPKNIYAEKVLLGSLAQQIKPGDKSAEDTPLIKKAIEAYQQAINNPQFTSEEKSRMDHYLVSLYGKISEDELKNEMQRRASDAGRAAKDRAEAYVVLAGKSWDCSYRITSTKSALEKSEIEKVERCVAFGMEYTDRAIDLDAENENAWSVKALLLLESAKLYGLKNDQAAKALCQRRSDEAQKRATELLNAKQEAEDKEWARQDEERKKDDSFNLKHVEEVSKELVEYKAETSLDEAVKRAFSPIEIELTTLVAPVPVPQENTERTETTVSPPPEKGCFREADGTAQVQEKRDWKTFAPSGEDIVVDLPDNVCARGSSYIAASEGVMYRMMSLPRRPDTLNPFTVDAVLNTTARTYMGTFLSGPWLGDGLGNSFELKFLRKEDFNGQPRKVYAYALISCSQRKDGMLIVQASKAHYYTIDISGASESDVRVQRFLKSLSFK